MSAFTISITCDGAAFESATDADAETLRILDGEAKAAEVARILVKLANRIANGTASLGNTDGGAVLDVNGNKCGSWQLS